MPKTKAKAGTWASDLRRTIKREHGAGWSIVEHRDKARLTHRYADGSRSTVTLDLEWKASNATAIANEIGVIRSCMDSEGISFKAAHERTQILSGTVTGSGIKQGAIDWSAVAQKFFDSRSGNRHTTMGDTTKRIDNAVTLLNGSPKPSDGPSLMKAYASNFFARCKAGGEGRKRHLGDVSAFLKFAVTKAGADTRWMPLEGEDLHQLIGTSDTPAEDTPPLKPEQLEGLLDHLQETNPRLWLAVALVSLHGLRPAELAALTVEDGKLYVGGQVKRNRRTQKTPKPRRRVIPLELHGRDDGARALAAYDSGLIKLPTSILSGIDSGEFKKVGDAFRQYLERDAYWASLATATEGLTPYSMRHGWAWRAHKYYDRPLSVRDAAALMGHTPTVHNNHYGRWVDEESLEAAVERVTSFRNTQNN